MTKTPSVPVLKACSWMNKPSTILLLDGGTSTHLESLQLSHSFPDRNLWSSSLLLTDIGRTDIRETHEEFYSAGSDIVTTVTYQLSHYACQFGYDEETIDDLLKCAVQIAKRAAAAAAAAAGTDRYVVASVGCYGAVLADGSEYTGDYDLSIEELIAFHKRRVQVLLAQDVHGLAFETIPCVREVEAIIQMMSDMSTTSMEMECKCTTPVWLSLACKNGVSLNDDSLVTDVLQLMDEMDPDGAVIQGVGVNCCKVQYIYELSQTLARHVLESNCAASRAIVLYPNSGEEWDAKNNTWMERSGCTDPEDFAMEIRKCVQGIHDLCNEQNRPRLPILVGGCCRTSSATIKALRKAVDEFSSTL